MKIQRIKMKLVINLFNKHTMESNFLKKLEEEKKSGKIDEDMEDYDDEEGDQI